MSNSRFLLVVALLILILMSCDRSAPMIPFPTSDKIVLKGYRMLELDANAPEDQNYDLSMERALALGAESIRLSIYWDDFETSPGIFNPDPNWLMIANQYYTAQDISISLVISVLDTTEIRVPDDLDGQDFSIIEMSERFMVFLDYVKSQLPDVELTSLAIGNEIDGVLGSDKIAWESYLIFYEKTSAYARELWPDLPVSTKVTFGGLTGKMAEFAQGMYDNNQVVMTTYYPLNDDFTVQDPEVVLKDFQILTKLFPGKEIHITEIGYPTSEINQSDPEKQAQFIHFMFQAWDKYSDQITLLSYSWLSDLPETSVHDLEVYYGVSNKAFGEFLRTLGLRTYPGSGENKVGFEQLKTETEIRDW